MAWNAPYTGSATKVGNAMAFNVMGDVIHIFRKEMLRYGKWSA